MWRVGKINVQNKVRSPKTDIRVLTHDEMTSNTIVEIEVFRDNMSLIFFLKFFKIKVIKRSRAIIFSFKNLLNPNSSLWRGLMWILEDKLLVGNQTNESCIEKWNYKNIIIIKNNFIYFQNLVSAPFFPSSNFVILVFRLWFRCNETTALFSIRVVSKLGIFSYILLFF